MSLVPMPLPWATALIRAGGERVPDYGSPEWAALPDDSPAKVAACVLAAECWRAETDPAWIAWRLRAELDEHHAEEADARWTPEVVAAVHRSANRPSYVELCERRGEPERAERAREQRRRLRLTVAPGA
jgi:hypothetical protein